MCWHTYLPPLPYEPSLYLQDSAYSTHLFSPITYLDTCIHSKWSYGKVDVILVYMLKRNKFSYLQIESFIMAAENLYNAS